MHYVLIMLLMFAPMRGVLATPTAHCDMDDMTSMSSDMVMQSSDRVMSADDDSDTVSGMLEHSCCCCDNDSCGSDCDMGVTVSLLRQPSSYSPVYSNIENLILYSVHLQIREFAPPSRPPLNLS